MSQSSQFLPISSLAAMPRLAELPRYLAPVPPADIALSFASDEEEDGGTWSVTTLGLAAFGGLLAGFVCLSGASSWVAMFVLVMVLGVIALVNPRTAIFLTLPYLVIQG